MKIGKYTIKTIGGSGINQEYGILMALALFIINSISHLIDAQSIIFISLIFLAFGIQTAIFRGGLLVSKKGKFYLDWLRNWLFIYSSIFWGLIHLGILDSEAMFLNIIIGNSLALSIPFLLVVVAIKFLEGGMNAK